MRTHNIHSCLKKIDMISLLCLLIWLYNNPQLLELPLSRTHFHSPKGVRAIEVRLYYEKGEPLIIEACLCDTIIDLQIKTKDSMKFVMQSLRLFDTIAKKSELFAVSL